MRLLFSLLFLLVGQIYAQTSNIDSDDLIGSENEKGPLKPHVHIISYSSYYLPGGGCLELPRVEEKYHVTYGVNLYEYVENFSGDFPELHKIVFIDYCMSPKLFQLPKEKMICFKWEAVKAMPVYYEPYYRVYAFDDDLLDGRKFYKFYYPVLQAMLEEIEIPTYSEKKFCTMVVGNYYPVERREMAKFFKDQPDGIFDLWGTPPEDCQDHPMYKGRIRGSLSGKQKLATLKNYRFGICFENTHTTPGYITEKIFDYFAAGCVPVYWGPDNVAEFIPEGCFIDYRQFESNDHMLAFLESITEAQYNAYLANIRDFLSSDQAQLFSVSYFEDLLLAALDEPPPAPPVRRSPSP